MNNAGYMLPVFVITRTGANLNEEGSRAVRDLVLGDTEGDPLLPPEINAEIKSGLPPGTKGAAIHHGPDLLNPETLAKLVRETPNARVVMSYGDWFSICPYDEQGREILVGNLEHGAELGMSSWDIINSTTEDKDDG